MRARIVLPVLALGLMAAAAAWLLRPGHREKAATEPQAQVTVSPESAAANAAPVSPHPPAPAPKAAQPTAQVPEPGMESPQQREQDYVQERVAQLMDLAMDDQPASLQTILSELNNREPEIRQAAVQAAMQFGSRDAIPQLQDAMDQTEDVREKAALLDAIEFLQAPSPTELAAARAAAGAPAEPRPAPRSP